MKKGQVKGINVLLFGGDIIYKVFPEAFQDYKAGLRYRALTDPAFEEALLKFEDKKEEMQ